MEKRVWNKMIVFFRWLCAECVVWNEKSVLFFVEIIDRHVVVPFQEMICCELD